MQLQRLRQPRTGEMAVYVRQASLIDDERILTDLAQRYLSESADERRFRWLYRENPFGPARAWIAYEKEAGAIGMAAVFPRRMYCDGGVVSGCVLGDLCIATKYRSLGPALQLQRACLECARSEEFAMGYDFPSTTMLGMYERLGILPVAKLVRVVKILRIDEKIRRVLPARILSRPAAAAANFSLSLTDRTSAQPSGLDFRLEDAPCTSEYSELAARIGSSLGICTVRNAEYLNWRYWQHPQVKYEFLAARRASELVAYCAFTTAEASATIADLFGSMDDQAMPGLLHRLVVLLRARGVATVSLPLMDSDPRTTWLRKMGFWAREAVPVMALSREGTLSGAQMFLMHGDRES
jgi:hypothetical protein